MTDLPMLQACLEANPTGVYTVWVTTSDDLRQTVSFLIFKSLKKRVFVNNLKNYQN